MRRKSIVLNLLLACILLLTFVRTSFAAPQGPIMVWLLSAGPNQARVKYDGQIVNVTKCFSCAREEGVKIGLFSINMSLLQPCIGSPIMAVVDKGEILSLHCGERTPGVLVIPDVFLK